MKGSGNIILTENQNILLNENDVAATFNNYFSSIVDSMGLFQWPDNIETSNTDVITEIINKYKNHPSITEIKSNYSIQSKFSFKAVSCKDVRIKLF